MGIEYPALAALGGFALYLLVVGALWRINRVDYPRLAESNATVVRGIVVPIGAGLAVLVVVATLLGWWPDVLSQSRSGHSWSLVVPVLVLVAGLAGCLGVDYRGLGSRRVLVLATGALIVGVAEELLARGLLVVGAQRAEWSLVGVWLFSTVLFSLLHAINALFGMPWQAMIGQLVMSFLGGSAFFATLMVTGSLLPGIVLHALWDFQALGHQASGRAPSKVSMILVGVTYLLGLVAAWLISA